MISMEFRKPHRIPGFDYSSALSYFITFNTLERKPLLSVVRRDDLYKPPEIRLKPYGRITQKYILQIESHYPNVTLDNYVIMPDHVHLLFTLNAYAASETNDKSFTAQLVQTLKSLITKEIGHKIWQLDFYDTVADTENLFLRCDAYIDNNPAVWLDRAGIEPPAPKQF